MNCFLLTEKSAMSEVVQTPRVSRLAVASTVLSSLSFPLSIVTTLPTPLLGLLGIFLGLYVLRAVRRCPMSLTGGKWACVGLALGILNVLLVIISLSVTPKPLQFA